MVNKRDAMKVGTDVALSLVAEKVSGTGGGSLKNAVVQNTLSSTVYHYALREHVVAWAPEPYSQMAAKGLVLAALKAVHYWADGMAIRGMPLLIYAASQAAGELVEQKEEQFVTL